jgi:dipeptidyl aminopeptidase/acylaminoacyl peptidase
MMLCPMPITRTKHRRLQVVLIFLLLFWFLSICSSTAQGQLTDPRGWVINKELLSHSKDTNKKVELFWTKPTGDGPYPAILFIHGHQEQVRDGGESYARIGRLGMMANRGYVASAVSQPGYGNSDGPADFCGPFTQDAVLVAIDFLRNRPFVDRNKVVIFGYSRGSIVASMVATKDPMLAALILGAGAYDFFTWYPTGISGINSLLEREAGTSSRAFRDRSAIYHVEKIKTPILLLHGAKDERIPVKQAKVFAEKLKAQGIPVKVVIFPRAGHGIPVDEQYREIYPFLEEVLR